jgi:UDP-N-acetylmuramoyl-tripeptide--D-alanyl-D-alanine ligase
VLEWSPEQVAGAAGGRLARPVTLPGGPARAVIDSRVVGPGDLFVGLVGEHVDGGRFAAQALAGGAWGALVAPEHAGAAVDGSAAVIVADDPLGALQRLATAWRRALGCPVVGITGSVGKTSTKDILAAMLSQRLRTVANRENLNTEIGLPMTVLEAPAGTEALVLEMGMRGPGQIAELTAIAEPDVGLITAVAPVHLELMGSIEAIAAAKAELVAGLRPGGTAIVPAGETLLDAHRRDDVTTVTFGPGGDVQELPAGLDLVVTGAGGRGRISAHMRRNALAALAAARAVGVEPDGVLDVALSSFRGQRIDLPGDIVVVNDCYNANPMSMRAALDDLAASASGRRVAVLGDMLELGPDEDRYHAEIGAHARDAGVDVLVAVGPRAAHFADGYGEVIALPDAQAAAAAVGDLLAPGDTVLVKGSRGVGLEVVARALEGA